MNALVVLGYHEFAADGSHGISAVCRAGVRRAEQLAAECAPALVVFTGWSSAGGPSEAEQMRDLWEGDLAQRDLISGQIGADATLIVEPRARNTAENAAYSLRVLVDHGIDRATIVCSIRHRIRVPYLFGSLFREHGVDPGYEFIWRPLPRPHVWLLEAGGLALMRRHRRDAIRSVWG